MFGTWKQTKDVWYLETDKGCLVLGNRQKMFGT